MQRIITTLLLCCFASWAMAQGPNKIRITNGEWPPYLSESLPNYGPSSQVVAEAFKLQGIDVEWGFFPWQRSYNLAEEGKYDGSVIWSDNAERRQAFVYSDPVLEESRVLFHLKGKTVDWNTMQDLSKYRIGGTIGYEYSQEFQDAEKAGVFKVERVPEEGNNLKKLLAKRIDLFVATKRVGYSLIESNFSAEDAAKFTHASKPIDTQQWSLIVSNKSANQAYFVEQFNQGLAKLRESGRYAEIMSIIK